MIRIIKDKSYAVPYERWNEYKISAWLNRRDIDNYFDKLVTWETYHYNKFTKVNMYDETDFVCFKNEEDATSFMLVFGI